MVRGWREVLSFAEDVQHVQVQSEARYIPRTPYRPNFGIEAFPRSNTSPWHYQRLEQPVFEQAPAKCRAASIHEPP